MPLQMAWTHKQNELEELSLKYYKYKAQGKRLDIQIKRLSQ